MPEHYDPEEFEYGMWSLPGDGTHPAYHRQRGADPETFGEFKRRHEKKDPMTKEDYEARAFVIFLLIICTIVSILFMHFFPLTEREGISPDAWWALLCGANCLSVLISIGGLIGVVLAVRSLRKRLHR